MNEFQTREQKLAAGLLKAGSAATQQVDSEERRLILQALVVGVVVWALVMLLKLAAHWGFHGLVSVMDHAPHVALIAVPLLLGAVAVATIAHFGRAVVYYRDDKGGVHELNAVEGDGLERAIALYFSSEPSTERALLGVDGVRARWQQPTITLALKKVVATFITLCTGGSGGLEASVTLIGESTSAALFKPRPFLTAATRPVRALERITQWWQGARPEDLQAAQLCGIAAAIATLLGTPFFAAFFAIEVMYRRRPIIDKLIYALISALVAFFLTHMTGGESPFHAHPVAFTMLYDPTYYAALLTLAVSISIVGLVFTKSRAALDHAFHRALPNIWARHAVGAVMTAVVAVATAWLLSALDLQFGDGGPGSIVSLVLGSGEAVIEAALLGKLGATVAIVALVAKLLATLSTITSGGSAGLLFPTMFFGTTIAVAWSVAFGFADPIVLIAPALTASLVSIANVPLAAIFVVVELFGATWIVPALVMVVTVSILRHDNSIYRTQHDTFDRHEILPGIAVHHLHLPAACVGKTLAELDIRRAFGLTVIAIVQREPEHGLESELDLNPSPDRVLRAAEMLVAVGDDDAFALWDAQLTSPERDG